MRNKIFIQVICAVVYCSSVSLAQSYKWNNPSSQLPAGCTHGTYHSTLMNVDVGYNVFLPPNYSSSTERYPVVYSLHGMSGNEGSNCQTFASVLKDGITSNAFPPVIMVFVSGRGNTFFSDSKDGTVKGESTVIKELIPFIDSTYRTKADRTQRAIEGVSMGGFGALMLGLKHPDVFASIGSYDAALVNWDTLSQQQFDQTIPNSIFGKDRNYFNENSYPFTFAKKNAEIIKSLGIKVRMITGDKDAQMGPLYYYNLAMRDTLKALGITLDFKIIPGGTHGAGMNGTTGKENMVFHTANFKINTTHVGGSAKPQRLAIKTSDGLLRAQTVSYLRLPSKSQMLGRAVALYDLHGRVVGQLHTEETTGNNGGVADNHLSSCKYMLKIKR